MGVRPPWPNPMTAVVMAGVPPLPSAPPGLGWRATPTHHRRRERNKKKKKKKVFFLPPDRTSRSGGRRCTRAHRVRVHPPYWAGPRTGQARPMGRAWTCSGPGRVGSDPFGSTRPKQ
ncbi:hypothetical protein Scep_025711 [Stephania cephalantha]|uniref:Uncharacterized protein n=1 Tax=Stephania cephalantha TaxID=152367 RepID=A0AAP0HRF4_9MAGN